MLDRKSAITLTSKRFFLFRLLARIWWFVDLFSLLFAPFILCGILFVVHLVIYRFYYLSFSSFVSSFVYPENEHTQHD